MKLRCTNNSIRFRLRKSDIEVLKSNKIVQETVQFPGSDDLLFSICISENPDMYASFINHEILVYIPSKMADEWINSDQVSLHNHITTIERKSLTILLEKDFPCLDRTEPDRDDTFWELAQKK